VRRPGQSRHSRQNRLAQDGTSTVEWIANIIHVETVALLSKLDVDKHIDVEIKLD